MPKNLFTFVELSRKGKIKENAILKRKTKTFRKILFEKRYKNYSNPIFPISLGRRIKFFSQKKNTSKASSFNFYSDQQS